MIILSAGKSFSSRSANSLTSFSLLTSEMIAVTLLTFDAAFCKRSLFLPVMITSLPFSDSNLAISKSIPTLPPVIKTVLFAVLIFVLFKNICKKGPCNSALKIVFDYTILITVIFIPVGIFCSKKITVSVPH